MLVFSIELSGILENITDKELIKYINNTNLKADMDNIKVVPNPYVGTNAMEQAVINPFLNQPRRLMFTNIPSS